MLPPDWYRMTESFMALAIAFGLELEHFPVDAVKFHQFFVAATFGYLSLFDNHYPVGFTDGAEAVADDDDRSGSFLTVDVAKYRILRFGVDGAGRLVQNGQSRLQQQGAGDAEALSLAGRKIGAVFKRRREARFEPAGQLFDERGCLSQVGSTPNLRLWHLPASADKQIFPDSHMLGQEEFLAEVANQRVVAFSFELADVDAVNFNRA